MSNKKKRPENFLRRLLNQEGDFAYYTYEQLFGDEPPKIELILRTPLPTGFTPQQREAMPDGFRQTKATQILIALVYEENESEIPFVRMMVNGILYRNVNHLKPSDVQLALCFQKEPPPELLADLGYEATSRPGVYQSTVSIFSDLLVLVLSELSSAMHNSSLKLFARSQKSRRDAYNTLLKQGFPNHPPAAQMALAQIAALTETEMDEMSVEMGSALLSQMSGKSPGDGNNPLAKLSPEQVIQDVEAFLREQR